MIKTLVVLVATLCIIILSYYCVGASINNEGSVTESSVLLGGERRQDAGSFETKDPELSDQAQAVNQLLMEREKSDEPASNVRAARDEVKSLLVSGNVSGANRAFLAALEFVAELDTLVGAKMCTSYGGFIMLMLNRLTDFGAHNKDSTKMTRLERVVKHYGDLRVNNCELVYQLRFKAKINRLDKEKLVHLSKVLDTYMDFESGGDGKKIRKKPGRLYAWARMLTYNSYLTKETLKKFGVKLEEKKEALEAYHALLIEPCDYFNSQLKDEVFNETYLDSFFNDSMQVKSPDSDYYRNFAIYSLCQVFSRYQQTLTRAFV